MDNNRFAEKTTLNIRELSKTSAAIKKMYFFDPESEDIPADITRDLLNEKINTPIFGTVRKFPGRLLVLLSYTCAANCRYCERQDRVGVGLDKLGRLTRSQIDDIVAYIAGDETISEVIASGGDPLVNPKGLEYLFDRCKGLDHVKVLRIHTRFPLQTPRQVNLELMERLASGAKTVYLSLHVDHPDELTVEVLDLIAKFRRQGYVLISQSVFLRGVNDSVEILARMFSTLFECGVRPYYIYHCQRIPTTARFEMDLEEEVRLMSDLRTRVSGLAYPQHVIDLPAARGKAIVPSNAWDTDLSRVADFDGMLLDTHTWEPIQ